MKKILSTKWKYVILIIYGSACVLSLLFTLGVKTNYDMSKYLPGNSATKKSINIIKDEFGYPNMIELMVDDISIKETLDIKEILLSIDGIESVLWLDDVVDVTKPVEQIDETYINRFYKDSHPLMTIELESDSYALRSEEIINNIKDELNNYSYHLRGATLDNIEMRNITANEIGTVVLVIAPMCILILLLASTSYLEPVLILLNLGIAILINMGSNILLGEISNITLSMSSVLLLAMSMDYSIFLIHRYYEKIDQGIDKIEALSQSVKESVSSISASALTTVMGFVALFFMRYTIGFDIGIVLAKGVIISFVTTIVLLPIMIYFTSNLLNKLRHKPLIPKLGSIVPFINKFRYVIFALLVVVALGSYYYQSKVEYIYGNNQASDETSTITIDNRAIESKYGINNPIVIVVPFETIAKEIEFANELQNYSNINSVQSIVTLVDPYIPRDQLPSSVLSQFVSDEYVRFIVNVPQSEENNKMYQISEDIEEMVARHYDEYYLAGIITSTVDIKNTIIADSIVVNAFSIIAIGLVILLIYKSVPLPFILVGIIQTSIWINMGIPYFQDIKFAYIGYLICSSLQLGATIDYAVLLSSRYLEFRKTNEKLEAIKLTLDNSSGSVIISCIILTVAGFSLGFISNITAVTDIGILLGRGALLSGILVLFVLPSILIIFDKWILKMTFKYKRS